MKITIEKNYAILIATLSSWIASLILILFPTIGLTATVFPPRPVEPYKLVLLIVSAATSSIILMRLGLKHLFPDGFKIHNFLKSVSKNEKPSDEN